MQTLLRKDDRNLDLLRAIAVLAVLVGHIGIATDTRIAGLLVIGDAGVLAFFVHTSLVLMGSLASSGHRENWIRTFYVRRAFRIYPLAIVAILLVLVFHMGWISAGDRVAPYAVPSMGMVITNLLLVQNLAGTPSLLAVTWSLPVEVQMYITLPFCFLLAKNGVAWVIGALVAGVLLALLWKAEIVPGLWRVTTLRYVPCFIAGVLAFAIWNKRGARGRLPSWLWPCLLTAVFGVFYASVAVHAQLWFQWAFCLVLGVCIPRIAELQPSAFTKAAHIVAKYSYGIYLFHIPALWIALVTFRGAPPVVQWGIFALVTASFSWVALKFVEAPMIRWGQRVADRQTAPRAAVLAS